jgi:hypothetical protein
MLYALVLLLLLLWVLGFAASIGGGLIHLLLVLAIIVFLFNFLSARGRTDI